MTAAMTWFEPVREAWASIAAPPAKDLELMEWGWGENATRAFTGVAPVDVDRTSAGFFAATPLLDLPPRAAAAYLGTFLLSLLEGLDFQHQVGLFSDPRSRAHTLTALQQPHFWESVIRPHLPPQARAVLTDVVRYLATEQKALAISPAKAEAMLKLALA